MKVAVSKKELFLRQKKLLDTFLEHDAITKAQHDHSLNCLKEKMGFSDDISVCGANCGSCDYLDQCKGCNYQNGFVFYCDNKECPIHICCTGKELSDCGKCGEFPCQTYLSMRDPRMSDDEFTKSVENRRKNLINN